MWSVSWTDRLVRRQQLCGHCTELSWWGECWAKRWSFRFTNQSTSQSEIWVMTKRVRSWIQSSDISFPSRVARLRHRDRVRSSDIQEDLRVEPLLLHVKWSQMRLFGYLIKMPHLHLEVFQKWKLLLEGDPRVELERLYTSTDLVLDTLWSSRRNYKVLLGRRTSRIPYIACYHCNPTSDKRKTIDRYYLKIYLVLIKHTIASAVVQTYNNLVHEQ